MRGFAPWREIVVAENVLRIPNMLSREEQQYLVWLTAEVFQGWGAVVDLGPWLGCSSAAMAEGLLRGGKQAVVHSFDLFQWSPSYMEEYFAAGLGEGADFMPVFRQQTAAYADSIRPRQMDLMSGSWSGGPIEILFVDAAKTIELTNAILRSFAPSLVPGQSIVVLQDFKHMPTWWLPLVFGGRPDLWEELHDVQTGDTSTYRLRAPLDAASGAAANYTRESFTADEVRRVFPPLVARPGGERTRISFYRALLECGDEAEAEALLAGWLAGATDSARPSLAQQAQAARAGWCSRLLPEAWGAISAGQLDRAEQMLLSMRTPEDPHCLIALARVAQLRGDHRLALDRLQLPLRQQPQPEASAVLFTATSSIALGDHDGGTRAVLELLRSRPQLPSETKRWACSILMLSWEQRADAQIALTQCGQLLGIDGQSPDALVTAALLDLRTGAAARAREKLARAVQIEPNHAGARSLLTNL